MALLPPHPTHGDPRPRIRPITDGTLSDAERLRLLTDWRCEDGIHTEYLSRRERDRLVFLAWRMAKGRYSDA